MKDHILSVKEKIGYGMGDAASHIIFDNVMLYMMFFGAGTIPLMSLVVYISNFISVHMREKILKAVPFFVIILGTLFVIRGMGLDIPFLSPGTLKLFVTTGADCY